MMDQHNQNGVDIDAIEAIKESDNDEFLANCDLFNETIFID
jgi:hypothetical protein